MLDPNESPLMTLADAAFRRAASKVVLLARQTGTPVIVWEGDRIRYLSPDEVQLPDSPHVDPPDLERA